MDGQKRGRDWLKSIAGGQRQKPAICVGISGHAAQSADVCLRWLRNIGCRDVNTVKEFAEKAFAHVDLDWREFVRHDNRYERPAEVDLLIGDAAKAKKKLDWEPKVRFEELVRIMVDADLTLAEKGSGTVEAGRL